MAVYRGKYVLEGLGSISPEMEADLDLAYGICTSYRGAFPCEMCGRCCHQPNILVCPDDVERIAAAAGTDIHTFLTEYVRRTGDGRMLFRKEEGGPCRFLGGDGRCSIWEDRPRVCGDFPYMVSMFMSRVYLALTNEGADIMDLIGYMDDTWPCTREIKSSIESKVAEGRAARAARTGGLA